MAVDKFNRKVEVGDWAMYVRKNAILVGIVTKVRPRGFDLEYANENYNAILTGEMGLIQTRNHGKTLLLDRELIPEEYRRVLSPKTRVMKYLKR